MKLFFKGKTRAKYLKILEKYEEDLSQKDIYIYKNALVYLNNHSKIKPVEHDIFMKLLSIYEIPISHLISYTNKQYLIDICKKKGLTYSNKKLDVILFNIRTIMNEFKNEEII
jgi:hypothetical protein